MAPQTRAISRNDRRGVSGDAVGTAAVDYGGDDAEDDEKNMKGSPPSYRELVLYVASTVLVLLSEPLHSNIDMTIVSISMPTTAESVVQVAALGPATTFYNLVCFTSYALTASTTNQLAPLLADREWRLLRQTTSHSLGLAMLGGVVISVIVCGFGRPILARMIGDVGDPTILELAVKYCIIRGLVAPAGVCGLVAQFICLACCDTTTPLVAIAVSSVINIVGDLILSPRYGIVGDAVATAASTVASAIILLRQVTRRNAQWKARQDSTDGYMKTSPSCERSSHTSAGNVKIQDGYSNGMPSNKGQHQLHMEQQEQAAKPTEKDTYHIPFASLPDRNTSVQLARLVGPIFLALIAKLGSYAVLTIRATKFGVVPLAAHNMLMRIFLFFMSVGDALGQASQTFFPSVRRQQRQRYVLLQRLVCLALVQGTINAILAWWILEYVIKLIMPEPSIQALLASHAFVLAFAVLLHPIGICLEGIVLSNRSLGFLTSVHWLILVLHCGIVFSARNISTVWLALLSLQAMRTIPISWKVFFWSGYSQLQQ